MNNKYRFVAERINQLQPSSLFKRISTMFQSDFVLLNIPLPADDVLRAEVFIQDIFDVAEDECLLPFQVEVLIILIFDDFIRAIQGEVRLDVVLNSLKSIHTTHLERLNALLRPSKPFGIVTLTLEIKKASALRGEVFLMDMNKLDPALSISLRHLIVILFLDFVKDVRTGNRKEVMDLILQKFISVSLK